MKSIGIVANPASGKDIRRLIAYGSATDNTDKVNIARRIILGAAATGVETIYYMQEYYGILPAALDGLYSEHRHLIEHMNIVPVDMIVLGIELDTVLAVESMRELGVDCIITLGGDGTNRAVAKSSGDIPLIPISTGTNNVFPQMIEGTIAGQAAGIFASGRLKPNEKHILPTKRIEIMKDGEMFDMALIDAVVLNEWMIASRALWKTGSFEQVFLTKSKVTDIGVSSIGAQFAEVEMRDSKGLYLEMGEDGERVGVPIAPGLMTSVGVKNHKIMEIGDEIKIKVVPCTIAVDGERDIDIMPDSEVSVKLTWDGPKLLNSEQVLADARDQKVFFGPNAGVLNS